ncbi:Cys-tRNA(Pro) deacylase [Alteromonas sp. D210916BOD_24]|uniref:Cys-tRNA(Pro) deacylase n=1 Tax=Alteromonas sp. D210916BOD_24 TaxID=3157618 RepID=UPI00399CAB2C
MTPAITLLQKKRIAHDVLKYQHDSNAPSYGLEAAEKLNLEASAVFKTLVVASDSGQLAVAVVPVNTMLSEKKMAKILGVKKVAMAKADHVIAATGYILGGVSPLGQKKSLPTVVHNSAQQLKRIYVSAGRRGLEVALSPDDLTALTRGRFADITG